MSVQYVVNQPMLGNGPVFQTVDATGSVRVPISTPIVSCNKPWSNAFTQNVSLITITPSEIAIPSTIIGIGTGLITTFPLSGFGQSTIKSWQVYASDWRGNNLQSATPITNLCPSAVNFGALGGWIADGVVTKGSSWTSIVQSAFSPHRPAAWIDTDTIGLDLNNCFSSTDSTVKTTGSYGSMKFTGHIDATKDVEFTGFTGVGPLGTLNLAMDTISHAVVNGAHTNIEIFYKSDLTTDWIKSTTITGDVLTGSNDAVATVPVQLPVTFTDIATLKVKISLSIVAGNLITDISPQVNLFDIVYMSYTATSQGSLMAPDGSDTGTSLVEDSSYGEHDLSISYYSTGVGIPVSMSVYAINSGASRYLYMSCGSAKALFNLATGTVINLASTLGTAIITPDAIVSGQYRLTITGTETVVGDSTAIMAIYSSQGGGPYLGDGKSNIGIWGCQIQEDAATTPLILTVGLPLTDFVSFSDTDKLVTFGVAPLDQAIITGSGISTGLSQGVGEFSATFSYEDGDPTYIYVGVDPKICLSYSDDGGSSWSPERIISMGKIGDRRKRCIWRRLGQARDRVYRVVCSEPVKFSIIGAEITAQEGNANG